mgnify:CR=1 FL=1
MFNFKIFRGAGNSPADAGVGTILLILQKVGGFTTSGICIAVDDNDRNEYEVGCQYDNISPNMDRWVELSRNEAWEHREMVGKVAVYHTTEFKF